MGYQGYGLPLSELISKGNLGVTQAFRRSDPDRSFRLPTFSMWWIGAAIQDHMLRSWSLVRIGTTSPQKKLFFSLRKLKRQMQVLDDRDLKPDQVEMIAGVTLPFGWTIASVRVGAGV